MTINLFDCQNHSRLMYAGFFPRNILEAYKVAMVWAESVTTPKEIWH